MSKPRQNIRRAAERAAASMAVNQKRGPALIRPVFVGMSGHDWTDLEPAQYPEDTVEFIRLALAAPDRRVLDAFVCDGCLGITITRDRHPGFHPRLVDHRKFDPSSRCAGTAVAVGYPEDMPSDAVASHEWYRPAEDELLDLPNAFIDHVLRGGLLLRIIPADIDGLDR